MCSSVASRSVAAAADSLPPPRVIDADDEADDRSVAGSQQSASQRSASFDKTMEWLMTCTSGASQCPPDQSADPCGGDAHGSDAAAAALSADVAAECSEMKAAQDPQREPDDQSRSSSPTRSVCQPLSESAAADDELSPVVLSDDLNIGLHRRRVMDGSVMAAEQVAGSDAAADRRHRLEVQTSRQTLMSSVDSETGVRNSRRPKHKVLLHNFKQLFTLVISFMPLPIQYTGGIVSFSCPCLYVHGCVDSFSDQLAIDFLLCDAMLC